MRAEAGFPGEEAAGKNSCHGDGPVSPSMQTAIKALAANNMAGYYIADRTLLFPLLSRLIAPGATVGSGDSLTLEETGVFDYLRAADYRFLDKHQDGLTAAAKRELYLSNFRADTFIAE